MGFEQMTHDNCIFKCTPFADKPPIYVGLYVDDFIYYSKSDKVEQWFESNLKSHVKVEFMGDVEWFLGQRYEWHRSLDGEISCHISQEAFIDELLDKHNMVDSKLAKTPYRSGCVIDRIPEDDIPVENKKELVHAYQSILGCLNWLCINTRPDISTVYKLLSRFNSKPSQGHLDAAKYVLRYLKHTSSLGIWFQQNGKPLESCVSMPVDMTQESCVVFTDSNWGPQDASKPKENETRTVDMEELKSVQGFFITRMGGPLMWGVTREKRGSRSSCIAELKAIDEGIKGIQFLKKLMQQLGLPDVNAPTPVLNDNRGSLDWIESGCRPSKKLRHENLAELGIAEAKAHNEVTFHWIAGKINSADIFTKEDNDVKHYTTLRDGMLLPREDFGIEFRLDHQMQSPHKLHPRGVLRNSMEHDSELIDTQRIAGKGNLPCSVDESEPFNFGSLSPHQLIATE